MKIRFIEPGNLPYKVSIKNLFVYDKYIRTPSHGLLTLATIASEIVDDVLIYSESISGIKWEDVLDSDIIFISIFAFNANRGYELAEYIRKNSNAQIVFGGLHATLCYKETINYCDYVLVGEGDELISLFLDSMVHNKPINYKGVVYKENGNIIYTGDITPPTRINIVPNRHLMYNYKKMAGHNTIWPQVHASRGCPHNCDYCSLVHAFGRSVRVRDVQNVIDDIKDAIEFHENGHHRLAKVLWITDDNFFANRKWAIEVLNAMIKENFTYSFTIQARYEVGYDDELLDLLKKAGFVEVAMGIEFLEDEAFENYNKSSTYSQIVDSVTNIQKHGIRVRGLFIFGADNHTVGVGKKLADFVIKHDICGVLIQSMYFIPGTPVYETHKDKLLFNDWTKCNGSVVHYPESIKPTELQNEIIIASSQIYSIKRLFNAIFTKKGVEKVLFVGEFFWQKSVRSRLKKEMVALKKAELEYINNKNLTMHTTKIL